MPSSDEPIERVILDICRGQGWTIGTAESCTGGLVAARLTSVPGSSDVFVGGLVTYANATKMALLDVPEELLELHGAVSPQVADAMVRGARARLRSDIAVAVTGIAGPGGGSPAKPVGLVHLAAAGPSASLTRELHATGEREAIRTQAATAALELLLQLCHRELTDV